jgi:hypothetical protein
MGLIFFSNCHHKELVHGGVVSGCNALGGLFKRFGQA